MTTDVTTIRLPHTGLNVPDASLSVAAYRQHQTRDGVAFTASLRVRNKKVGLIENDGHGGETSFFADRPRDFGHLDLTAYAEQCRTQQGEPVTDEDLLHELIEEYEQAKWVTAAARKGLLALRKMEHTLFGENDEPVKDFPPRATEMLTSRIPTNQAQYKTLAQQILAKYPVDQHSWWQMWDAGRWQDISPRPAYVNAELYG